MLVEIFYHIDEFCKIFSETLQKNSLPGKVTQRRRSKQSLSLSEIMTICIYYHYSGYKNFKAYYTKHVLIQMNSDFKKLVSYNRFVELQKNANLALLLFLKIYCENTGMSISFIDSFSLPVCHNKRIPSHKVFKGTAQRGQTSMGWFYGFKVHLIINPFGEIVNFALTPGNIADNNENLLTKLTDKVFGKLFGDKGYMINRNAYQKLYEKGIHIVTRIRKNMSNILMDMSDKLLLNKRGVIESAIGILKETFNIDHSRHRSPANFLCNTLSALTAYCFRSRKPSIASRMRVIH